MTSKHPRASGTTNPTTTDDLKLIPGIGPAIEGRLHRAGIRTYAQLAAQSPAELAKSVQGLSLKRITEQKWISRARKLASRQVQPGSPGDRSEVVNRQRYATFALELLLDDKNRVRRTHVRHIQNGDAATWVSWHSERLVDFVVDQAGLQSQPLATPPRTLMGPAISQPTAPVGMITESPMRQPTHTLVPASEEPAENQKTTLSSQLLHTDLQLQIGDMRLIKQDSGSPFPKHLSATLTFQLSNNESNRTASSNQSRYFTQVLAWDVVAGRITVLAIEEQTLLPDQLVYSKDLVFSVPLLGCYKLVVLMLLPDEDILGVTLGPTLNVIL